MSWTCEQSEARLSDYLDGVLNPAELAEFTAHVPSCARCAPLVASVSDLLTGLRGLEEIAEPPRLVSAILDKTLGPRESLTGWSKAHLAYASSAKFVNNLRVVNEIQSRLREENDLRANPESTVPESSPQKQPGRSDGSKPATPRQQNRANDLARQVQVLAMEMPAVCGGLGGL